MSAIFSHTIISSSFNSLDGLCLVLYITFALMIVSYHFSLPYSTQTPVNACLYIFTTCSSRSPTDLDYPQVKFLTNFSQNKIMSPWAISIIFQCMSFNTHFSNFTTTVFQPWILSLVERDLVSSHSILLLTPCASEITHVWRHHVLAWVSEIHSDKGDFSHPGMG